jgi:uncharacterized FlgJ-related protein
MPNKLLIILNFARQKNNTFTVKCNKASINLIYNKEYTFPITFFLKIDNYK